MLLLLFNLVRFAKHWQERASLIKPTVLTLLSICIRWAVSRETTLNSWGNIANGIHLNTISLARTILLLWLVYYIHRQRSTTGLQTGASSVRTLSVFLLFASYKCIVQSNPFYKYINLYVYTYCATSFDRIWQIRMAKHIFYRKPLIWFQSKFHYRK